MNPLLELKNIYLKGLTKDRLLNVSLKINEGDKIALLGRSGEGKTTLISLANGSIRPTKGEVYFNGRLITQISQRNRVNIATLWQDLRLIEELNTLQNINIGAIGKHNFLWAVRNLIGLLDYEKSINCMKAVGLETNTRLNKIGDLSGGQKQRVALARAIRQEAQILLADEPLTGLDPELASRIIKLLLLEKRAFNILIPSTCLVSIHRLDLLKYFTRVIGIKNGQIEIDSSFENVDKEEILNLYRKT